MISEEALALARRFEGLKLKPYRCPAGIPTIGYGHVIASLDHPAITKEIAETLLRSDMAIAVAMTIKYCPNLAADPPKLAAISDFVFNLGGRRLKASTLRLRIRQRDWNEVCYELKKWIWGGGKKLPGLILRRNAEANMLCNSLQF